MSIAFCSRPAAPDTEVRAMLLGLFAVALFSLTLPFTRMAVGELDPLFLALGRALGAAVLAAAWLAWKRAPLPPRAALLPLILVAAGCIVGYPLLTSIALRTVPAGHGALLVGVLPLATTLYAALRDFERPSRAFWAMAAVGSGLVALFALVEGGGGLHAADLLMFAAVLLAAMGYAEGGRLSRTLGGPQTICWALLLAAPVLLPILLWQGLPPADVSARSWFAFGYVTVMSTMVGFFLWYRALALGGVARVGQVQLLQPFLSLLGAAVLLGEALTLGNCLFALAVAAVVFARRQMAVHRQ
ncbi:DMT family transporter [Massilia sp. G4R7]|uniref:DMT family transporter n=1 Tax=Massilia phyllostachyos TaxID=2898585 RepID=A0ABS8QA31_9BURK|nr:DMT family transporter [Massilia phyllostachyos]MCD2518601.1 DMT family transporter [Massilia phyllostachyos]